MNTGGGFFFDAAELNGSSESSNDQHAAMDERDGEGAIEVRKLTQKQETRLMDYLDDALLDINRGYSKRYTAPKSSQVPTLEAFLSKYDTVLGIIASIPPLGPSAALLVSYLLRVTSEMTDGIQGYDLHKAGPSRRPEHKEQDVERALLAAVKSIAALDRFWAAVLRGQMIQYRLAQSNANEDAIKSFATAGQENTDATGSRASAQDETTGRYPRNGPQKQPRDARAIVATRGYATVPQTQRIRLRNIVVLARDGLFTWMRNQLDAPPPPLMDDTDDLDAAFAASAATETTKPDSKEAGEDETELEEVEAKEVISKAAELPGRADEITEEQGVNGVEQEHYNDLFSRKLDPDDSDEDDDDDAASPADTRSTEQMQSKRSLSASETDQPASKQARRAASPSSTEQTENTTARTLNPDNASLATLGGTQAPASQSARVLRADVAFAHLFSRTLRILSDIQERTSYEEGVAGTGTGKYTSARLTHGEADLLEDEGDRAETEDGEA